MSFIRNGNGGLISSMEGYGSQLKNFSVSV